MTSTCCGRDCSESCCTPSAAISTICPSQAHRFLLLRGRVKHPLPATVTCIRPTASGRSRSGSKSTGQSVRSSRLDGHQIARAQLWRARSDEQPRVAADVRARRRRDDAHPHDGRADNRHHARHRFTAPLQSQHSGPGDERVVQNTGAAHLHRGTNPNDRGRTSLRTGAIRSPLWKGPMSALRARVTAAWTTSRTIASSSASSRVRQCDMDVYDGAVTGDHDERAILAHEPFGGLSGFTRGA